MAGMELSHYARWIEIINVLDPHHLTCYRNAINKTNFSSLYHPDAPLRAVALRAEPLIVYGDDGCKQFPACT